MPPVIDINRLQEIRKKLKDLPKVERPKTFSGPEALEALKKDIRALSRKGYDSKEIARFLKQEGLAVSSAKVKRILVDEAPGNEDPSDLEPDQPGLEPDPLSGGPEKSDNSKNLPSPSVVRRSAKLNGKEAQQ